VSAPSAFDVQVLTGLPRPRAGGDLTPPDVVVEVTDDPGLLAAAAALRHGVFVTEQGLFAASDRDDVDDDPRTRVLVARTSDGTLLGAVRVAPARRDGPDLGWWAGSRLVVAPAARGTAGVGAALVRAACASAEAWGALRFDATVQARNAPLFRRLGWVGVRETSLHGAPHVTMRWPLDRVQRLATATKAALGGVLAPLLDVPGALGGPGFLGDDGVGVPGSDVVAACDAVLPSLVERDPEWAGWCAVLVNLNDLTAMGAEPVGLLDALAARDASFASRVVRGLRDASAAWGVPVLGGHTQFGVPAALSVTALGRARDPVPAGGGRPGHALTVTADLGGGWRPGYTGAQWDSTTGRTSEELRALGSVVARTRPAAAKDVSMAGLVGTVGMLAEASGCRAVLDVDRVPAPASAGTGDWLTCFPGFAVVTADAPGRPCAPAGPAVSAACGELGEGAGVGLRWPDGEVTEALAGAVTGWGRA